MARRSDHYYITIPQIVLLAVVVSLITGALGYFLLPKNNPTQAVSDPKALTAANTKIAALERELKAVKNDNSSLESQLFSANTRIDRLEKQVKGIDNIMASLSNPFAPGDEVTGDEASVVEAGKSGTVTITPLNIRKEANASSAKVGALTKGTKVQIIEEKKVAGATWYKISSGSYAGWVHGNYIKLD